MHVRRPVQPRFVAYVASDDIALRIAAALPYTDIVLEMLTQSTEDPSQLRCTRKLRSLDLDGVRAIRRAGKSVLVAFRFEDTTNAMNFETAPVSPLARSISAYVEENEFDGVEILIDRPNGPSDRERESRIEFFCELTCALFKELPENGRIIAHSVFPMEGHPQIVPPYEELAHCIAKRTAKAIEWVTLRHDSAESPAQVVAAQREICLGQLRDLDQTLLVGLPRSTTFEAEFTPERIVSEIVEPLKALNGRFGGVASAHYAIDDDEGFARVVGAALMPR